MLTECHSLFAKEEARIHKNVAMDKAERLRVQSESISRDDSLMGSIPEILNTTEGLNRLLQIRVSKVAPQMRASRPSSTRRRSGSSQSEPPSNRSSDSAPQSTSTPFTTPSTPSSGVAMSSPRRDYVERELRAQHERLYKTPRRNLITDGTAAMLPNEVNQHEQSGPIIEADPGIIGPVIRVDEQNEVQELHRKWRSDIDVSEEDSPRSAQPNSTHNIAYQATADEVDDAGKTQIDAATVLSDQGEDKGADDSDERPAFYHLPMYASSSDGSSHAGHPRQSRRRMSRRISDAVDIFAPDHEASDVHNADGLAHERWKPMAPFDQKDGRRRRKRSSN
jgi:hypothetical protein